MSNSSPAQELERKSIITAIDFVPQNMTFSEIADEWYESFTSGREYSEKYLSTIAYRLKHYIKPVIGDIDIARLRRPVLVRFLNSIAKKGHFPTAKRIAGLLGQIFSFAQDYGYIESNPGGNLSSCILGKRPEKHFAHLTKPEEIGALLAAIRRIRSGRERVGLLLAAYCFPRCGEILKAEPKEFDFEKNLWTIPGGHTKSRREMCIPLAPQVVEFLKPFAESRKGAKRVFTQTENAMLRTLDDIAKASNGKISKTTIHGFRHTASTILYSKGYNSMWIELSLAHRDRNSIRAVYNSYDFLKERRQMLCEFADYLDELTSKAEQNKP